MNHDSFPPITVRAGHLAAAIAIDRQTWDGHVAVRHPEVSPYLDCVIGTIEQPEIIARDATHPERVYFLKHWPDVPHFRRNWLQVLVLLPSGVREGRLLSAWATRRVGGKEIIWQTDRT